MKEPSTKLPWHLMSRGFNKFNVPTIYATGEDLEYVARLDKDTYLLNSVQDNVKNAEYIVQSANNFPEAVRLLKESLNLIGEIHATGKENFDKLMKFNEIQQFLTKLEEDEKDTK